MSPEIVENLSSRGISHASGPRVEKFPVVFFESYSILKVLFLVNRIRMAGTVLFFRSGLGVSRYSFLKRIVRDLIRQINPKATVRELEVKELVPVKYHLNKEAVRISDSLGTELESSKAFRMLRDVVGDEKVMLFYKGSLSIRIGNSLLYAKMAECLLGNGGGVSLVPDDMDTLMKGVSLDLQEKMRAEIPPAISCVNWILEWFCRAVFLAQILVLPMFMFLKQFMKNGFASPKNSVFDVVIPVLWGIFKDTDINVRGGVRRFMDDTYLYGRHFSFGDILHVFGDFDNKSLPLHEKMSYKEAMDEKGIPYAERIQFGVNFKLLWLTMATMGKVTRGILRHGEAAPFERSIWHATLKGVYHFLLKSYEMENINYRVELVRNDYNPGHVIATIIANRYGRKRIGVAHAGSPIDTPQLSFVHFDSHAVSCDRYAKTFSPYWDSLQLEKIGRESIDSIIKEGSNQEKNRHRIESLYGKRKWVVTVMFPGSNDACLVEQWDKMYRALAEFQSHDLDCHIFFRFRNVKEAQERQHMDRFLSLPEGDPRIILDHENFNTHELIVASDLIITANASFGINEALVAGIPVFTFGYMMKEHLYFPDYGRDFILTETEDVLKTLRGLETGFSGFDCDWDRLRRDADYFHDGKNSERLSQVVFEFLQRETTEAPARA